MKPPRLARWLLQHVLPARDRHAVLGDLDEEFAVRGSAWYWRQALGSLPYGIRRRLPRADWIARDVRFTLRMWRRQPAFVLAAVTTQAVGIAITTAVLAVAYAVLIRPLPYQDPDRLVHLFEGTGRSGQLSYQDFLDARRATRTLERIAGYSGGSRTLQIPGQAPERLPMLAVSDGFFETLGVTPVLGRTFTAGEMVRGGPALAILSHDAWTRRFGADPDVVGHRVILGGIPHEIVGVLPASFAFPLRGRPELWLPLQPSKAQQDRGYMHWMAAIARPRPDVTPAQVQTDLDSIARGYAERDATNHSDAGLRAVPLREMIVAGVRPTIQALVAGVLLVVLVACATTATLLLSRAAPRRRELSVRSALGATRGRIVLQLLTETVLLSVAGGAIGIAAGHWLLGRFVSGMPLEQRIVLPHFEDPGVGLVVGATAFALSIITGVLFGIVPAWRAARLDDGEALKGIRVTAGPAEGRLRSSLVTIQVAVALVLLASVALLGASVQRLMRVPLVADAGTLATFRLNLPPKYATPDSIHAFNRQLVEALQAMPGVTGVGLIDQPPLGGSGNNGSLQITGQREPTARTGDVLIRSVSERYLETMRVPLIRGRSFSATDTASSPQVVLINRLLADTVFAGTDPLTHRISFQFLKGDWQIVGIVDNERFDDVDRPLLPAVYFAMTQDRPGSYTVMLRAGDPGPAVEGARQVLARLDPEIPMFGVRTIEQIAQGSAAVFLRRATLWMLGTFAIASLVLAAMGLYGVLAQVVADRTREIGVRVALGATRPRIVRLILRDAVVPVALGTVLGIGATFGASRWLSSLLFAVSGQDPLLIGAAAMFLVIVALAACVVPVRRALGVDPATAVRVD